MSNQHVCDVAGTLGKLTCVATRGCWCNSKVIHCTIKYREINTTNGKYEYTRQFCSVFHAILSVLSHSSCCYMYFISLFNLLLWLLTRRFCSLNSLFPLLVIVIASQSCSPRRSLRVFILLTCYFRY